MNLNSSISDPSMVIFFFDNLELATKVLHQLQRQLSIDSRFVVIVLEPLQRHYLKWLRCRKQNRHFFGCLPKTPNFSRFLRSSFFFRGAQPNRNKNRAAMKLNFGFHIFFRKLPKLSWREDILLSGFHSVVANGII